MESVVKFGGWIVALVMLVVGAYILMVNNTGRVVPAEEVVVETPDIPEVATVPADELAASKAEVAHLRAEVEALQNKLNRQAEADADEPPEAEPAETPAEEPTEEKANDPSRGDRIANAQMALLADMTYKPLFDELGIAGQARDDLNQLLAGRMIETQRIQQQAMQAKDKKAKDVHAQLEAKKAELRAELAKTLTAEGLDAWDAYEPVADQMLYERLVDGQLNMMAPGVTEEYRVMTSQVMAEELVREFEAFNASDELYTIDNFNGAQARALNTSLERLSTVLPQDQYDGVNSYVNQALLMFNAMAEKKPAE